jgi:hypothetical protein
MTLIRLIGADFFSVPPRFFSLLTAKNAKNQTAKYLANRNTAMGTKVVTNLRSLYS